MTKPDIIFENDDFLAVNKPSGMFTIPDREGSSVSLKDWLSKKYPVILTVHRLDRDTSGILLFAKNEATHKYLSSLFEERKIEKYYLGIVKGLPQEKSGIIEASIAEHPTIKGKMCANRNGKASKTGYEVLEAHPSYSLVSFQLYTGRTHQIRVHCQYIGHPLACDPLYGDGKPVLLSEIKKKYKLSKNELEERPIINQMALLSYRLVFADNKGNKHDLSVDIPKEYRALMNQISKNENPVRH